MEIVLVILIATEVLWFFVTEKFHNDLVALTALNATPILASGGPDCVARVAPTRCPTMEGAHAASLFRPRIRRFAP